MYGIKLFIRCFTTLHLFISSIHSVSTEEPLKYNPRTLEIYNLQNPSSSAIPDSYAVACPAETSQELKLNRKQSLDQKALFVKQYHSLSETENIRCEKGFKLAVAHRRFMGKDNNFIQFGYEIYFGNNVLSIGLKFPYHSYGPITETGSSTKQYRNMMKRSFGPSFSIRADKLNFTWIAKVKMQYAFSSWIAKRLQYKTHRNAHLMNLECHDYDLGKGFFKERKHAPFDTFYSPANQEKIFSQVELPELPEIMVCKKSMNCIKKYNLSVPYQFKASPTSSVSCSNLTTVPIWYEINESLLNYLDVFLTAIGQIAPNELTIFSGVLDTISMPRNITNKGTRKAKKFEPMPIYLYSKYKKIPIPKVIYKIARYETEECLTNKCRFEVLIVIHNEPAFPSEDKLCQHDKCQELGWESIQYSGRLDKMREKSKYIYCCKLDSVLRKRLSFDTINLNENDDLNLYRFPFYQNEIIENRYENKKQNFEEKANKLMRKKFPNKKNLYESIPV